MDLTAPYLPQSWHNGEAPADLSGILTSIKDFFGGVINSAAQVWDNFQKFIRSKQIGNVFAPGTTVNFGDWLDEDPVGAFAGGLAVGLTWVVEFFLGGAALKGVSNVLKGGGMVLRAGGKIVGMFNRCRPMLRLLKIKNAIQAITLGQMVRWGVGAVQRVWNFNFNQTDKKIRETQKNLIKGLAPVFAEALGSVVGTFCGFGLGRIAEKNSAKLIRFNPTILAKLNELKLNTFSAESELWEESITNLKTAVSSATRVAGSVLLLESFMSVRKIIRGLVAGIPGVAQTFTGEWIAKWGIEERDPWSFAKAQEKMIEKFPEGWKRASAESFVEGAQEACAESTLLVSYAL